MKRRSKSLKGRLLITIYFACLIPFILGGIYLYSFMSAWFYETNEQNTKQVLEQVDTLLNERLVEDMKSKIDLLTKDNRITQGDGTIRDYLDIEASDDIGYVSEIEEDIAHYFKALKESHNEIYYVFIALDNGSYIEYPDFKPTSNYDPRSRPWYMNTVSTDEIMISEPYISSVTKDMVMSYTKSITLKNGQKAVVGLSVSLELLTEKIGQVTIEKEGYVLVLNQSDTIIVSPKHTEWLLKKLDEVSFDMPLGKNERYYKGDVEGEHMVISIYESPLFKSIGVVPKKEMDSQLRGLLVLLISLYLVTFLIIFLVIDFITNRFTKPILDMAECLSKVGTNMAEIDVSNDTVISKYQKSGNEIGIIARAIYFMMNNVKNSMAENKIQSEYIEFLAYHDSLTELSNRHCFLETLEKSIQEGDSGCVILMDLDNFKSINDTLGHIFGDQVLKEVANRLMKIQSNCVNISRFGGDEFLILIKDKQQCNVEELLKQIQEIFQTPMCIDEHEVDVKFSMGVCNYPQDSDVVEQVIMNADLALYNVKQKGRNNYYFYEAQLMDSIIKRSVIEDTLKNALTMDGFELVYQPIVDTFTGEIASYEALLRLKDNRFFPSEFIPVAEEDGSIIKIGRMVLVKAIQQLSLWREKGHKIRPISINFSARQLIDNSFFSIMVETLSNYNIEPKFLELEITENIFLENKAATLIFLNKIKSLGVKISIDDFGKGYSSLNYLTFLPIDKVKLDRAINIKFLKDETQNVMKSIIQLAHSLNLVVVAEGIESEAQYKMLKELECDLIQGYIFSRPLQVEAVDKLYNKNYLSQ